MGLGLTATVNQPPASLQEARATAEMEEMPLREVG